jgi:hypothetical protein
MGERVCLFDGRAMLPWAVPEYEHLRLWTRSILERERLVVEPGTRDPSDAGLALTDVMDLPADGSAGWTMVSGDAVVVPASPQGGGLVLRALPRSATASAFASSSAAAESGPPSAPPPPPPPSPARDPFDRDASDDAPAPRPPRASSAGPIDLATAVRTGRAKLLPDVALDRADVGVEVAASDAPILVPAGELLRGGAGDRVFADGAWLPGTGSAYVVRLSTRPVDRHTGRLGGAPDVVGAVAGPELRALLARGEDAAAVLDLVHVQLRDAGLLGPEGADASEPSLLALYAIEPAATLAQAKRLVRDLGENVTGFVAADPSGRFQGLERVDVPGEPGRAVLARLVAGYLAEARVRSASDGARTGVQTTDVLGALSKHPPRLAPPAAASRASVGVPDASRPASSLRGIEPRTGLLLQGVRSSGRAVPLLSGLVRDFVK